MNQALLSFFNQHYAPGRVGLIGQDDLKGRLIRDAEAGITPDHKPSKWSHTFLLAERRADGRNDGRIYIFESDLRVSVDDWEVQNGVMESRLVKWCLDNVSHGCVLGMNLSTAETTELLTQALSYAYDEEHLRYPVCELFGTLWADRKSTRLNSSHGYISYAVFCLKKKKKTNTYLVCNEIIRN